MSDSPARSPIPPLIVLFAALLILLPSVTFPFGPDDGAYAYAARRMLKGDVLYRDVWDQKLGIYFFYAGVFRILGDATISIRLVDIAWHALTALLVYYLAAQVYDQLAAAAAGILYSLFYMDTNFWSMAQADSFLNLPSLAAILCWIRCVKDGNPGWAFWGGIGLGVATLFRPTAIVMIFVILIVWLVWSRGPSGSWDRSVTMVCVSILAAAMTWIPFIAYFVHHGALGDFANTWFRINTFYVSKMTYGSIGEALYAAAMQVRNTQWYDTRLELAVIVLGPLYAITQFRNNSRIAMPIFFLITVIVSIAMQKRLYVYQWSPAYPPLAILGGGLLELRHQFKALPAARRRLIGFGYGSLIALLIASCLFIQGRNYFEFVTYLNGSRSPESYHRYFVGEGFSYPIESAVSRHVKARSKPGERICIWGLSPLIYYLSERDAPARLFLSHIMLWPVTPQEWKNEFFASLKSKPPAFFLIRRNDIMPLLTGRNDDSRSQVRSIPQLKRLVNRDFQYDRTIGYFDIYRRRTHAR